MIHYNIDVEKDFNKYYKIFYGNTKPTIIFTDTEQEARQEANELKNNFFLVELIDKNNKTIIEYCNPLFNPTKNYKKK